MSSGTIFGIFLIAHGLVHAILASAPRPDVVNAAPFSFWSRPSWLLAGLGQSVNRPLSTLLWAGSTLLFVAAGLAVLGLPGMRPMWQSLATVSAVTSLLLLSLYWHPWLVIGVILDAAIILALIAFEWSPF